MVEEYYLYRASGGESNRVVGVKKRFEDGRVKSVLEYDPDQLKSVLHWLKNLEPELFQS